MEEAPEVQEDLGGGGKLKDWLQDNIRIILSVLIVVAIAAGIYSYSKRAEAPLNQEEIAIDELMDEEEDDAITIIGEDKEMMEEDAMEEEEIAMEEDVAEVMIDEAEEEVVVETVEEPVKEVVVEDVVVSQPEQDNQAAVSEESDDAFIEKAVAGDSKTTLARKALRNYLEKNNDSSLTAEHKIYIEDYLQKSVGHSGGVAIGSDVAFSKTLLRNAIEKSKTLSDDQLNNLKKYSSRVSNL